MHSDKKSKRRISFSRRSKWKVAKVIVNVEQGRKVFASPIHSAVEEYLAHRKTEIREAHETHGITSDWHSETGKRYSSMRWHEKNVAAT